jgi:hypothetical protein
VREEEGERGFGDNFYSITHSGIFYFKFEARRGFELRNNIYQ